jgi:hypothetical protein
MVNEATPGIKHNIFHRTPKNSDGIAKLVSILPTGAPSQVFDRFDMGGVRVSPSSLSVSYTERPTRGAGKHGDSAYSPPTPTTYQGGLQDSWLN